MTHGDDLFERDAYQWALQVYLMAAQGVYRLVNDSVSESSKTAEVAVGSLALYAEITIDGPIANAEQLCTDLRETLDNVLAAALGERAWEHDSEGPWPIGAFREIVGQSAPTLRAWERRYRNSSPMRSAGGHRLYSNDDLRDVRALQSLIENGIPPSIAAQQIREKTASQVVSLPVQENEGIISGAYTTICNRIIEAIEAFDPEQTPRLARCCSVRASMSTNKSSCQ